MRHSAFLAQPWSSSRRLHRAQRTDRTRGQGDTGPTGRTGKHVPNRPNELHGLHWTHRTDRPRLYMSMSLSLGTFQTLCIELTNADARKLLFIIARCSRCEFYKHERDVRACRVALGVQKLRLERSGSVTGSNAYFDEVSWLARASCTSASSRASASSGAWCRS